MFIQNDAKIGIKHGQLSIKNNRDILIPLEDIATILIESPQCSLSSYALGQFAQKGITTILCDQKRLPCGVLTPMNVNSRQLKMINVQMGLTKPLKKRIWQRIVVQKILNQAKCLDIHTKDGADILRQLSKRVDSGDTSNVEAVAATKYFRFLFGNRFLRGQNDVINAAMNYGYSIIRSLIARQICSYGFTPCIGIHHHNELNNFNLADDLIEPFRALVDSFVFNNFSQEEVELTSDSKITLFNLVNYEMTISDKKYSVHTAITHYIRTFMSACKESNAAILELPALTQ